MFFLFFFASDIFDENIVFQIKYNQTFFSGITFDSKRVKKNNIFFAIKGNEIDGNNFIQDAIKKGSKIIITEKKIKQVPFWVNQNLWFSLGKDKIREKYGFKKDSYLVGSFQRDTEGADLASPKLENGPDLFCDYVIEEFKKRNNLD